MPTIKTTVNNGLPCLAQVTYYSPEERSTYDYEGTCGEIEFDLQTRKGKPAPWIYKAASQADLERIGDELIIRIKEMKHEFSY